MRAYSGTWQYWDGQIVVSGDELNLRFSALLEQHAAIAWKVAYAWCRQAADREDLVQEIHYQLWRAFLTYDSARPFSTWMYRIALNVAISADRRRRRSRELALEDLPDVPEPGAGAPDNAQVIELFSVIDGLDPTNRAMLLLWLENHSYSQIADVLGLSETNVATRLSRLRAKLKTQMKSQSGTKAD